MTNEGDSTSGIRWGKNGKFTGKYINCHKHSVVGFTITNMSNNNTYRLCKILGKIGKVENMVLMEQKQLN